MKKRKFYLWIDTETAGLLFNEQGNPLPGQLMELSAILTDEHFHKIFKKDWIIKYSNDMKKSMSLKIIKLHTDNHLIQKCKQSSISKENVDNELINIINKYTKKKDIIMLAGNSVYCDKEVIRRNCPQLYNRLYYRVFDVSSVKELLLTVDPSIVKKAEHKKLYKHRALPDIEESINEIKDYWITFEDVISSYKI